MRLIDADALKKQCIETDKWGKIILILDVVNAPTIDAVPTDFHDKCMEIEISKRINIEKKMKKMERCEK